MSLFSKIRGTIETFWQVGLGGPQWKNNAGAIEGRNSTDSAFALVRGATALATNDLVTFAQLGTLIAPITSTIRTNSANATYTIDTTGGGADGVILNNRNAVTYVMPAPTLARCPEGAWFAILATETPVTVGGKTTRKHVVFFCSEACSRRGLEDADKGTLGQGQPS